MVVEVVVTEVDCEEVDVVDNWRVVVVSTSVDTVEVTSTSCVVVVVAVTSSVDV